MIDRLSQDLNFYQSALGLRHQRQEVLAANIANADTPGYKAREFDFASELRKATGQEAGVSPVSLALTSARHIPAQASATQVETLQYRQPVQPSLDGNTVEMDVERVQFADNTMRYQADLALISQRLRSMQSALQQ